MGPLLMMFLQLSICSGFILSGYLCPTCPSAPNPNQLINNIHNAYDHINIAFIGWETDGTMINQFDDSSKGFTLTKNMVATLQGKGKKVFVSLGGGAGGVIMDNAPPQFSTNMANGILQFVSKYGFDGVDFDIEHRSGDMVKCGDIINTVIQNLKIAHPQLLLSVAPQMTNLYPDLAYVSAGWNEWLPVIAKSLGSFTYIQPQMYNTWSAVETIAYAKQYTSKIEAGWNVTFAGGGAHIMIPASKVLLGYPSSRSAAGSGYIDPSQIASMVTDLGSSLAGIMTWSIGWDEQSNWAFASAMSHLKHVQ